MVTGEGGKGDGNGDGRCCQGIRGEVMALSYTYLSSSQLYMSKILKFFIFLIIISGLENCLKQK